ncbi:MAG: hypothetical protein EBT84_08730 [Sphingomonadaceae bacterium]|nr:hypothetical protein [Sphingomonadaceae bacterium]
MASKKLTGMGLFGYSRFERTLDQGSAFPSLSYIENSTNQFASSFRMARQKAITFHFPPAVMALT